MCTKTSKSYSLSAEFAEFVICEYSKNYPHELLCRYIVRYIKLCNLFSQFGILQLYLSFADVHRSIEGFYIHIVFMWFQFWVAQNFWSIEICTDRTIYIWIFSIPTYIVRNCAWFLRDGYKNVWAFNIITFTYCIKIL